jgi:hypothetical protein
MNAYVQTALKGVNFCESVRHAWNLIKKHYFKLYLVENLTAIVDWIGFLFIIIANLGTTFFLLYAFYPNMTYYWPALVAVAVFTLFISHVLFVLINIGAVALLHCYILDMDIQQQQNKVTIITPSFMVAY